MRKREASKRYYEANKQKLLERQRNYYSQNKDLYKKIYQDNKEVRAQYAKEYRTNNAEKMKSLQRAYYQRKRQAKASLNAEPEGVPSETN